MTITVRARPTATHTSTATPRATGTLRASRTSITVGGSTRVTGTSSAAFKFRIGSGLSTRSTCGASGQSEVSGQASSTITIYGCRAGSYTVRLLTTSNRELDRITITVRARPTATHTHTPTPTPRATGTLRASRTSITVGGSTRVTGTSSAAFKFRIGSGLSTRSTCGASGQSEVSGQASSTITLYGCRAGSYTVRLLTTSNRELARITITVRALPTATHTPTPTATPTSGGGCDLPWYLRHLC